MLCFNLFTHECCLDLCRPLLYAMAEQHKQLAAYKPKQLAASPAAQEQQQAQQ
jgi:hypothetical protein